MPLLFSDKSLGYFYCFGIYITIWYVYFGSVACFKDCWPKSRLVNLLGKTVNVHNQNHVVRKENLVYI